MSFTRSRAAATASLLAVAGTAAGIIVATIPASPGLAAARPATSTQVVVVNQCNGHGLVRPSTFDLPGCMPSNELIGGLKWVSWRSVAFGSGLLEVNNCTPSSKCGPSMFTKYPILTVLWRAESWPHHAGRAYFSRLTWIFTGKRPQHAPVTQTIVLPASVP